MNLENAKDISKITIKNLNELNIMPTPKEYAREFCEVSDTFETNIEECQLYKDALASLSREEITSVNFQNVQSIYDIVEILLNRPASHEIVNQTNELSKIMHNVDISLDDALITNGNAYNNIYKLKENLNLINEEEMLVKLKKKLVSATGTVCKELSNVSKILIKERQDVLLMDKKIKQLQEDLNKYKEQSTIDHLTGLLTRRHYEIEVSKFEQRYIRNNEDYAVVFFDLDYFKKINDNYGHDCGDMVLKTFGQILNKLTRKTDILTRYGGEEFVAIIKYNDNSELTEYLGRIKEVVTKNKFKYMDLQIDVTFSAGVDIRSSHSTYEQTIKQADDLLYNAKRDGRNRIILGNGRVI